jgi:cytidine deaminase
MTGIVQDVFVSYRRDDAGGHAGRLVARLRQLLGSGTIFFDERSISAGTDFENEIRRAIRDCRVVLVVIGPGWLELQNERGQRRLGSADDLLTVEIAEGLRLGKRLVPVQVARARMPTPEQLPQPIAELARIQSLEITESHWDDDVRELSKLIETEMSKAGAAKQPELSTIDDTRDRSTAPGSGAVLTLVEEARAAREHSCALFSRFKVGAALQAEDGTTFVGCSIESATHALNLCAERVALATALAAGHRRFSRLATVADVSSLIPPCAACRQLLWEFCGNIEVIVANLSDDTRHYELADLVPADSERNRP